MDSKTIQWKDPKKELPEKDIEVLAIILYGGGMIKEPDLMRYDGEWWIDKTGQGWTVIGWLPIPPYDDL